MAKHTYLITAGNVNNFLKGCSLACIGGYGKKVPGNCYKLIDLGGVCPIENIQDLETNKHKIDNMT